MKKLLLLSVLFLSLFSCQMKVGTPSSDEIQKQKTEQALRQADKEVGMPAIINFKEKKQMKRILELRDQEGLIMHAYLVDEIHGKIGQYLGKCLGYGLPYSTQFSNPSKNLKDGGCNGQSNTVLPQAEPNGLFTPVGLSATWLELVDPKTNESHIVYIEPSIIVSPFKLH